MDHRCTLFRRHRLVVVLVDVVPNIDRTKASFFYRKYCARCGGIEREWKQEITGLFSNGTGWTIATYREFIQDLLRIRPPDIIW